MPPEWVSMTGGSTWPTGNAAENLREVRLARGGGWREEHILLLSTADLDVHKEKTSTDLTSTHLLRVQLKTRWEAGSLAAFNRPIRSTGPSLASLSYKWHSCWAKPDLAVAPQPNTPLTNEPSEWCGQLASYTSASLNLGLFVQSKAGGKLVCNDRLVALVAPSSPCDISLVRWTQSDLGPTALGSPVCSPVWHTSHTSLSAISHSELNIM